MSAIDAVRVLVADDEREICEIYRLTLAGPRRAPQGTSELEVIEARLYDEPDGKTRAIGFEVTACQQAEEAVEAVRTAIAMDKPFAVAFLDVRMPPGRDGVWAAERIREMDPDVNIVIVTGFSDIEPKEIAQRVQPLDKLLYLQKPVYPVEVRHFAMALAAKWRVERSLREAQVMLESRVAERTAALQAEVSDRIRAEEDARESEHWLRVVTDSIQSGFFIVDPETSTIIDVNRVASELIGLPREEILGKVCHKFACPAEEGCCPVINLGQSVDNSERVLLDAAGRRIPILKSVVRVTLAGRSYLLESFLDITDLKRVEEEKAGLEARLRQSQRMEAIGTLAGGIAHDFNNLLYAISGFTDLAMADLLPNSPVLEHLKEVCKAADRAKNLVSQILTFSRQADREPRVTQVSAIVAETLRLIRATFPATIEVRQHLDMSDASVYADPSQLHQVIMNLCTNAHYAMKEHGGVLDVTVDVIRVDGPAPGVPAELPPGPYVRVVVSDTGAGMTPEVMERIFDPFFTTKPVGEGTGMGLPTVHGIVADCKGAILVESEVGKGTTFRLYLPESESATEPKAGPVDMYCRGDERILFVDDEESLVRLGRERLRRLGYRVTATTSSLEALALFEATPDAFDVVITDQAMPNMCGYDLAKELIRVRPDIRVILVSGFSETVGREGAADIGIRRFLLKPISLRDLSAAIREVMRPSQGAAPSLDGTGHRPS